MNRDGSGSRISLHVATSLPCHGYRKANYINCEEFQKDLLGTYFVESETRTKLELSVEMSNKTVQN